MILRLVKDKLTWIFLIATALMALLMTFSYLGAFLSPVDNTHNLPLAVVNGDQGFNTDQQTLNYGQQVVAQLTGPQANDMLKWSLLDKRELAEAELKQNKYYAVLVIPTNYSAALAAIANPTTAQPQAAQVEILTNLAAGTLAGSQAQAAAQAVVAELARSTSSQLVESLAAAGATLAPQRAALLGNPVQAKIVPLTTIGTHSARGMSAFYFALMLTLSGFIGTNILGTLIDIYSEQRHRKKLKISSMRIFYAKVVLYGLMAVIAGVCVTWMAVGLLGMDTPDWFTLGLFAILGTLAVAAVSLFFQTAFGRLGLLVGIIFFTILGVPASGGAYPVQMIPGFWQFLYNLLPMRYLTDGIRSLLFLGGNQEAGLGMALVVLPAYAISGILLAWFTSYQIGRRNSWEAADGLVDQIIEHAVEVDAGANQ
ncbi:MAG: YhgE/Pip family protein [Chloroflexota bacterium]